MSTTPASYNPRRHVADLIHAAMKRDPRVWVVVGDLGYKMWTPIERDFPDRFVNVGAEEHLLLGAGVGLALDGKRPICYSITPFLLLRGAEYIRNYLDYEKVPVKLLGSGLDTDYAHDGISHFMFDTDKYMRYFPCVDTFYPARNAESMEIEFARFMDTERAAFMGVRR